MEKTGPNEEKKVISNLRPFSSYNLAVTVFNNKGEGPPSDALPFETDEGGKGVEGGAMEDEESCRDSNWHKVREKENRLEEFHCTGKLVLFLSR